MIITVDRIKMAEGLYIQPYAEIRDGETRLMVRVILRYLDGESDYFDITVEEFNNAVKLAQDAIGLLKRLSDQLKEMTAKK